MCSIIVRILCIISNIKSLSKQLSYRTVVPRLLVFFLQRVCSTDVHLFTRSFFNPVRSDAYYFCAEKETTELRCAIKIVPPSPFSFLPLPVRCRSWGASKAIYMGKQLVAIMLPSCPNHNGRCLSTRYCT